MTRSTYDDLILQGIKGLPPDVLAEIVDYIYFVRKKIFQPTAFQDEIHAIMMGRELDVLSQNELAHLEDEFKDYQARYPHE